MQQQLMLLHGAASSYATRHREWFLSQRFWSKARTVCRLSALLRRGQGVMKEVLVSGMLEGLRCVVDSYSPVLS
jgi:hypothetical protein